MPKRSVPQILEEARATFEERNQVYKNGQVAHAKILSVLFPGGAGMGWDDGDWEKFILLNYAIGKRLDMPQL